MNNYVFKLFLIFTGLSIAVLWSGEVWNKHLHEREHAGHVLHAFSEIELSLQKVQRKLHLDERGRGYEEINKDIEDIQISLKDLAREIEHRHNLTTDLHESVLKLSLKVEAFREYIETFKSRDGILKNSIFFLRSQALNPKVGADLKLDIYNFLLDYFYKELDKSVFIKREYTSFERVLLKHVSLVEREYASINNTFEDIRKLELDRSIEENIAKIETLIAQKDASNKNFQIMFIFTVLVVISVVILMFKKEYDSRIKAEIYKSELEQFVNAMDESAIVSKTDVRGNITFVNDKFCEISGYTREELIGKPQNIVRHEDNSPLLFKEMWETIKQSKAFKAVLKNRKKDGTEYYVDSVILPLLDVSGEITGYMGVRYDITSIVIAKEKAQAAEKSKDEFLSNMSHELRTPLNAILGFSTIVEKKLKDNELKKYLNLIHSSSNQLLSLVNDILDISKIQSGKFSINPHKFNAFEDVTGLLHRLDALTSSKDLRFNSEIDNSLNAVFYGDWLRINQIITNILSNAIKFTPAKGEIYLKGYYEDKQLFLIIRDTGIGMNKEVQERVFKPFEQADGSTTRKYGGTGLGLSITQKLIEMMKGTLQVESEEGKGSIFTVALPLDIVPEGKEAEASWNSKEDIKNEKQFKGHVLVAEDNITNQVLVRILLEDKGLSCDFADNGEVAVQMYDPKVYNLLLMDENMPVMNGLEAFEIIRERYKELCGPVVALTANALVGDKEKFLNAGMDDYIAKPIDDEDLVRVLQKYLPEA